MSAVLAMPRRVRVVDESRDVCVMRSRSTSYVLSATGAALAATTTPSAAAAAAATAHAAANATTPPARYCHCYCPATAMLPTCCRSCNGCEPQLRHTRRPPTPVQVQVGELVLAPPVEHPPRRRDVELPRLATATATTTTPAAITTTTTPAAPAAIACHFCHYNYCCGY